MKQADMKDSTALVAGELSEFFGMEFEQSLGAELIREYAEKNRLVMTLDPEHESFSFGTEVLTFIVRHDLNENLEVVFQGVVRSYCPQQDIITTDYLPSIYEVLKQLRERYNEHCAVHAAAHQQSAKRK